MARSSSGTYTSPSSTFNPAVTGTIIQPADWNTLLDDLETAMTDSLSRTAKGGMRGQLKLLSSSGTAAAPALSFSADLDTGLYRKAANAIGVSASGTLRASFSTSGLQINSGVIQNTSGTAAAPSYTFAGDTNTGAYRAAANTIGFSSSGTLKVSVSPSGLNIPSGSLNVVSASGIKINNVQLKTTHLSDVSTSAPTGGYALIYNSSAGKWKPTAFSTSAGVNSIGGLTGVVSVAKGITTSGTAVIASVAKGITTSGTAIIINKGQVPGTATNDSASAGNVGEVISSTVVYSSGVSLTNNVPKKITSIALTPGDWDVWGAGSADGAASTTVSYLIFAINSVSATTTKNLGPSFYASAYWPTSPAVFSVLTSNQSPTYAITGGRISLSSSATYYLNVQAGFGTSTCTAHGAIYARRRR